MARWPANSLYCQCCFGAAVQCSALDSSTHRRRSGADSTKRPSAASTHSCCSPSSTKVTVAAVAACRHILRSRPAAAPGSPQAGDFRPGSSSARLISTQSVRPVQARAVAYLSDEGRPNFWPTAKQLMTKCQCARVCSARLGDAAIEADLGLMDAMDRSSHCLSMVLNIDRYSLPELRVDMFALGAWIGLLTSRHALVCSDECRPHSGGLRLGDSAV